MTPEQKIKWAILVKSQQATGMFVKCPIYEGNIDELYDLLVGVFARTG